MFVLYAVDSGGFAKTEREMRSTDKETLLGEPSFEFVHPGDHEEATTRMIRVLEGGEQK